MAARPATLADFRRIAPDLSEVSDADALAFLQDAIELMNTRVWGMSLSQGHAALAAHMAAKSVPEFESLASEKVGDVSKTYFAGGPNMGAFGTTRFGQQYWGLRRGLAGGVGVT